VPNFSDGCLGPREPEHTVLSVTTCVALVRSAGSGGANAATEEASRADLRGGRQPRQSTIVERSALITDWRRRPTMGAGRHDRFCMPAESRSQKHHDAEKEARVDGHKDARAQYQGGSDHCPVSCDPLTQTRPEAPCSGMSAHLSV
jgi:hypothetical protein